VTIDNSYNIAVAVLYLQLNNCYRAAVSCRVLVINTAA